MRTGRRRRRVDSGPIRVVLIDDVDEFRALLRHQLVLHPEVDVVGEARDGYEGVQLVARTSPDVVVLDLEMPNCDGITAIPLLREASPDTRILVLSAFPEPYTLGKLLQLGVDAYIDKVNAWSELPPTILALCGDASSSVDA